MQTRTLTLTQVLFPSRSFLREAAVVGGAVAATAAAAQVAVPLPFTPVPLTGQTLAVVLCGAALGSRRGVLAQLLYVLLGVIGLPIFAQGRHGLSPATGGSLLGVVLAAYAVGRLVELGWDRRGRTALAAMLVGNALIYACGLPWLALCVGGPVSRVVAMGLLPFVPGDVLKTALAAALLPGAWRLVGRRGG